jgi:XapX domain-containing protein
MKTLLISFAVGLLVGVAYGVVRVKSPAPPIVALIGLLGMVLGEQAGGRLHTKKVQPANRSSAHTAVARKVQQEPSNVPSIVSSIGKSEIPLEGRLQ